MNGFYSRVGVEVNSLQLHVLNGQKRNPAIDVHLYT